MGFIDKFKKKKDVPQKTFKQDLQQKAPDRHPLFIAWFLFDSEPSMPENEKLIQALKHTFGEIDQISKEVIRSFAVKKYMSQFKDATIPAQILLSEPQPYKEDLISDFQRSQLWNVPNADELLEGITHQLMISDMMSSLPYLQRGEMVMDWLEAAVSLFPDCKGVWIPSAGKLFTASQVKEHAIPRAERFVYFAVNVRFFTIEGTNDMLIDTLGLNAMGLPDIQYHFHSLEPNSVVNHAYNVASYLYQNEAPIKSGETIDGLLNGQMSREVQWKCQYEKALIQPIREVMDICPGEYAAGTRE